MQHAQYTKEELLQLCSNLKRKGSRIAILCTVDQLKLGDNIMKLLKVCMSAECSGMLEMILSPPKL